MKILSKIRAFFNFKGLAQEIEVTSAEIKQGKVFLHPIDDPQHTYCIITDAVDLFISPHKELDEHDIEIITRDKEKSSAEASEKNPPSRSSTTHTSYMPKMKTVSFKLYQDEYDAFMHHIQENGYRKTEYFLACFSSAKKSSMEANYKKYTEQRKERRAADREAARIAKAQEIEINRTNLPS